MSTTQNGRPMAGAAGEQVGQTTTIVPTAWQRANGRAGGGRTSRPVGRLASVIAEQPWFRSGAPGQRRAVAQAAQEAASRARDRKARVKAHPDLAARLCRALGYTRFEQWSGFVPPARDAGGRLNTSPVRVELLAILRAVADREAAD